MTPDQFAQTAIALLGTTLDWQTRIAAKLEVTPETVESWMSGTPIPPEIFDKFEALLGLTQILPWPRDEWLIGDSPHPSPNGHRREYIFHMMPPRFVARVVACVDGVVAPEEEPADILSGVTYVAHDDGSEETILCEFVFIDEVKPNELTQLLEAAADALEASVD